VLRDFLVIDALGFWRSETKLEVDGIVA